MDRAEGPPSERVRGEQALLTGQPGGRLNRSHRSLPHRRPFISALFFASLHYLSLVAVAAGLVLFLVRGDTFAAFFLAGAVGASGLTWLIAFLKRRAARCPLCKGTPLLDTGALTHRKAVRLLPLNYGTTAILSGLFTQRFRCMYCASRYDLLKLNARERYQDQP